MVREAWTELTGRLRGAVGAAVVAGTAIKVDQEPKQGSWRPRDLETHIFIWRSSPYWKRDPPSCPGGMASAPAILTVGEHIGVGKSANTDGVISGIRSTLVLELVRHSAHYAADDIRSYLSGSVGGLRHLELTILEAEIISRLMQGRRTRNELVEEIYQTRKGEPDYVASYTKVRRALEGLQSRGYVSTPPFAKEKPYKITSYAMQKVASVSPDIKQPRLVERIDPVLYAACLITGFVTLHAAGSFADPPRVLAALPASFFVLLGFSLARIWNTLRKVI